LSRPHRAATRRGRSAAALLAAVVLGLGGCAAVRRAPRPAPAGTLEVTATAYNSTAAQTDRSPTRTASGKRLEPGERVLAVSDDLYEMGLVFGTRVRIDGVPGVWVVQDRMARDRHRTIDLYLGRDREAALRFGRRRVRIEWTPP
jgi:3D (Asp-Asp-Asp) domain-containing protein